MSCARGGFPSIRHNEIRDLTATLLTEVCNNVCTEPELQPVSQEALRGASTNRQDGARLDIAANGFWGGTFERTYFDVRIFNPLAPSNRHTQLSSAYRKHERIKKRAWKRMSYDVTFYYVCTLCGRNPLKSRLVTLVTPRLLKRLGYFQQQSQKYELTLRLEMCFMKNIPVHNCA